MDNKFKKEVDALEKEINLKHFTKWMTKHLEKAKNDMIPMRDKWGKMISFCLRSMKRLALLFEGKLEDKNDAMVDELIIKEINLFERGLKNIKNHIKDPNKKGMS